MKFILLSVLLGIVSGIPQSRELINDGGFEVSNMPKEAMDMNLHSSLDVYNKPVKIFFKDPHKEKRFSKVFVFWEGLRDVHDYSKWSKVPEMLRDDAFKNLVVFHTDDISRSDYKDWFLKEMIFPDDFKMSDFDKMEMKEKKWSYLVLDEKKGSFPMPVMPHEMEIMKMNEMMKDMMKEEKIVPPTLAKFVRMRNSPQVPFSTARIPSFAPPFLTNDEDKLDKVSFFALPVYPADTFPYIPPEVVNTGISGELGKSKWTILKNYQV